MKPIIYALAGVAVVLALAAGPVAAQGRERPAGSGGSAASGGGEAGVRTGGGASGGGGMSGSGGAVAVPRGSSGSGSSSSGPPPGYSGPQSSGSSRSSGVSGPSGSPYSGGAGRVNPANGNSSYVREMYGSPSDRAVPRGSRPNPGGPVVGQAVPRGGDYYPPGRPPANVGIGYPSYPYYPYYPYYGWAFGLGYYGYYGLYDPWWGWGAPYGGDYGYGYGYGSDQGGRGGLKLKVEPTNAEVYVDGYYMGTVDDFDGTFQKLELEVGAHHVEIRAPGYQTIAFDVRIEFGDTVTYRGELQALSKR